MRRRIEVLRTMPTFELPAGPPTQWTVREQAAQARLSTAEAAIRALAICEGAGALRPVMTYFNVVSARMMFMKARIHSPQVPPTWTDEIRFDDPAVLDPDVLTGSSGDEPSRDA